jgi:hypothetical protein
MKVIVFVFPIVLTIALLAFGHKGKEYFPPSPPIAGVLP